ASSRGDSLESTGRRKMTVCSLAAGAHDGDGAEGDGGTGGRPNSDLTLESKDGEVGGAGEAGGATGAAATEAGGAGEASGGGGALLGMAGDGRDLDACAGGENSLVDPTAFRKSVQLSKRTSGFLAS